MERLEFENGNVRIIKHGSVIFEMGLDNNGELHIPDMHTDRLSDPAVVKLISQMYRTINKYKEVLTNSVPTIIVEAPEDLSLTWGEGILRDIEGKPVKLTERENIIVRYMLEVHEDETVLYKNEVFFSDIARYIDQEFTNGVGAALISRSDKFIINSLSKAFDNINKKTGFEIFKYNKDRTYSVVFDESDSTTE